MMPILPGRCLPSLQYLEYLKPNAAELVAMADELRRSQGLPCIQHLQPASSTLPPAYQSGSDSGRAGQRGPLPPLLLQLLPFAAVLLAAGVRHIVLTLGGDGAALLSRHHLDGGGNNGYRACSARSGTVSQGGDRVLVHVSHMEARAADVINLSGAGGWRLGGWMGRRLGGGEWERPFLKDKEEIMVSAGLWDGVPAGPSCT